MGQEEDEEISDYLDYSEIAFKVSFIINGSGIS